MRARPWDAQGVKPGLHPVEVLVAAVLAVWIALVPLHVVGAGPQACP